MSNWKATAVVRDVADGALRERLIAAYETLFAVAAVLDAKGTNENALVEAVDSLREDAKRAEEDADAFRAERELWRKRCGDLAPAGSDEIEALRAQLGNARAANENLIEGYADMLAMARKFVSAAPAVAKKTPKVRHVRGAT